jgi:hypothetical protein
VTGSIGSVGSRSICLAIGGSLVTSSTHDCEVDVRIRKRKCWWVQVGF